MSFALALILFTLYIDRMTSSAVPLFSFGETDLGLRIAHSLLQKPTEKENERERERENERDDVNMRKTIIGSHCK